MVWKDTRVKSAMRSILCLLIVTSQLLFSLVGVSHGSETDEIELPGRVIDLYTQKEPFSGRRLNQSSDAFAPQEEVILYAKVTFNDVPLENRLVSLQVLNPLGESVLFRTDSTNEDGVATVSFRLPDGGNETVFGVWSVYATVDIAEETVMDTLTFRFGYIVDIVSLVIINKHLQPQSRFARGSCVGVELTLRNIAMMNKTATLTIVVQDKQGTPFPQKVVFENFTLTPGDTYFYIYCTLRIPEWAALGEALLIASAFTVLPEEGGVPWCPGVSTSFLITWCDVAVVDVVPSVWEVEVGGVVEVDVDVINEGYEVESFNVSLYYDSFLIGERNVTSLAPGERETLFFVWNTSGVAVGDYRLKAVASGVPGETDVEDNVFEDGVVSVVEVRKPPAPAVLPRELLVLLLISVGALAFTGIVYLWYRKSEEMSGGRSGYEGGSSRRPFRSNPGDFASLRRRKRFSDSSVFAVIRLPFVEEE